MVSRSSRRVSSGLAPPTPHLAGPFLWNTPDALPLQRFADLKAETRTRGQSDSHTAA